jgi:RNA polymerase sigma-70 factor (ECF subfamily)
MPPNLSGTQTHATLLARLSGGQDPGAWSEFVARYGELIRGFARRRGLQAADVEDIAQEVLTSLTKAMAGFTYDPSKGKFRSYLKTVVVRAIARKSLQTRGVTTLEEIDEVTRASAGLPDVETQWEAEWRQYHVRQAMRTIENEFNEADRSAFEMYALMGRSAGDVARDWSMSVDQVYQAKSRITRRLAALVEAQVEEEG